MKRVNKVLAMMLSMVLLLTIPMSVGETQARIHAGATWSSVYTPVMEEVTSDRLSNEGELVQLNDWTPAPQETSKTYQIMLFSNTDEVEGTVSCSSNYPEYLTAALDQEKVTVDQDGTAVVLTLRLTDAAFLLKQDTTVSVRVSWSTQEDKTTELWANYNVTLVPELPDEEETMTDGDKVTSESGTEETEQEPTETSPVVNSTETPVVETVTAGTVLSEGATDFTEAATESEASELASEQEAAEETTETELTQNTLTESEPTKSEPTEPGVTEGTTETEATEGDAESEPTEGTTETEATEGDAESEPTEGTTETEATGGDAESEPTEETTETEATEGATDPEPTESEPTEPEVTEPLDPMVERYTETFAWTEWVGMVVTPPAGADHIELQYGGDTFPAGVKYRQPDGTEVIFGDKSTIVIPVTGKTEQRVLLKMSHLSSEDKFEQMLIHIIAYDGEGSVLQTQTVQFSATATALDQVSGNEQLVIANNGQVAVACSMDEVGLDFWVENLTREENGQLAYIEDEADSFGLYFEVTKKTTTGEDGTSVTKAWTIISNVGGLAPAGSYRLRLQRKFEGEVISSAEIPFFIHY